MDSKLSNVVGGILSKTINEKDPVFSQNKTLVKNSITKLKKNKSKSKHQGDVIHIKPIISNNREKELKVSATRGVVKFLNMIVRYKGNIADKDSTDFGIKGNPYIQKSRKPIQTDPVKKINRFDEVVRSTLKLA